MARSKSFIRCVTIATVLAAAPCPTRAQTIHTFIDSADQRPRDCYARPKSGGGAPVLVKGYIDNALRFWGYSTWDGAGHPIMIFNLGVLSRLPPIMARFTFYHECAHLTLRTSDEVQASCEGLKQMRAKRELSVADEAIVKQEHYRISGLGPQYLGSGRALWDATVACAGARDDGTRRPAPTSAR
jgi:hypothetical protein